MNDLRPITDQEGGWTVTNWQQLGEIAGRAKEAAPEGVTAPAEGLTTTQRME